MVQSVRAFGLAALGFAFVVSIPFGWRALFALSFLPLPPLVPLWRALPESSCYKKHEQGDSTGSVLRSISEADLVISGTLRDGRRE